MTGGRPRVGPVAAVGMVIGMAMSSMAAPTAVYGATGAHAVPPARRDPPVRPTLLAGHAPDASSGKGRGVADSLDWAGFADEGGTFSGVSGDWTQPTADCAGIKVSQSAFWVGIDGYLSTDPSVQQVGTDADCVKPAKKAPGGPSYYAWYELYPDDIVVLPTGSDPVSPGDQLSGSVTESGSTVTLSITDAGRWIFSTVQTAPDVPLGESAEWITEAPTACTAKKCKAVPLTDFGSVDFTDATADGKSVDASGNTVNQIMMAKNKKGTDLKATTSALSGGNAFTVTWVHA